MKIYCLKKEYNEFIKYQSNPEEFYKKYRGTPLTLELWANKEDLRCFGEHIKEIVINL